MPPRRSLTLTRQWFKRLTLKGQGSREDRSPDNSRFRKKSPRDRSRSPARDKSDRDKKHGSYNNGGKRKGKFNKSKGQNSNNKSGSDKQE